MKFSTAAALLLASATSAQSINNNYVTGCVPEGEFDIAAGVDYFPEKYEPPSIYDYDETTDIYGEQFTPHNTTDLLEITYFGNYKIVNNKHNNVSYLLYQCGTVPPQDEIDSGKHHLVLPVPHQGGVAATQTPQIPPLELLGLREEILAYIGNPIYVSSPCLMHSMAQGDVESVWDDEDPFNSTIADGLRADFLERHPDALIFGGPTDVAPWQDRTIQVAASQERTNVATFDWIALFAALYNMESVSNQISRETQARYDCTSTNAAMIVNQRDRALKEIKKPTRRQLQEKVEPKTILWATHFTGYNWSVASCPQWDSAYYCEYATHCGTHIISRPPDMGYSVNFGGPTDYWYLNDDELLELGKDADIWIFPSNRWDDVYATHNATMDQFKAVQNQQVYDNQGSGSNAWFEQRLAEYDVVGLDMCDLVGTANPNGPPHVRRWFRNIFTEPIGELPACNVPDELTEPYVPQGAECELLTEEDFVTEEEAAPEEEATTEEEEATSGNGESDTAEEEEAESSSDDKVSGAVVVPAWMGWATVLVSMWIFVLA